MKYIPHIFLYLKEKENILKEEKVIVIALQYVVFLIFFFVKVGVKNQKHVNQTLYPNQSLSNIESE